MAEPASQNPYMYCRGNPLKYSDPSGYNWDVDLRPDAGGGGALIISQGAESELYEIFLLGGRYSLTNLKSIPSQKYPVRGPGTGSIKYLRQKAVNIAWDEEKALVKKTGKGTYPWNDDQMKELLKTGSVKGFKGHHNNSVKDHSSLAGNADNITFEENNITHYNTHGRNWRNQTTGPLNYRTDCIPERP